jgi:hypothetical protein
MDLEKIVKVENSIEKLKDKSARIYLLVQDTKGNPKASIKYIYDLAVVLKDNGYNPILIHETKDYEGVSSWLDESYMELPHQAIDGQNLSISPEDVIIIPELYGHVMEQIKNLPCGKIVLCQAYDHMLETLAPGVTWSQLGVYKCITTSETQKNYISEIMKNVSVDLIEPYIDETFSKKEKPSKPIISIHTRDQRATAKIIKTFYLKYPQYRWITFRDMRGISLTDFSKFLKESFLSVWVDSESSFGTFPLESMSSGTPVIGKVPNMLPTWMNDENGVWVNNENDMVDVVANFVQNWLEDNISEKLYENMLNTSNEFRNKSKFESSVLDLFNEIFNSRAEAFQEQLDKLNITEQTN